MSHNKTTRHYMVLTPGHVYASDVYAASEREARRWFRMKYGFRRLPKSTVVWEKGK